MAGNTVGNTPRAEDPMVITSFRVPKSWLDVLEANGDKIGEYARAGIKARVDYLTEGGLAAIDEKIKEMDLMLEEARLKKSILEHQKEQIIQQSITAELEAVEKEKKITAFIKEMERLAPDIINNYKGTARYKIEYLASLSPGPGMQDITRFFQDRRGIPQADEIREFLTV